MPVLSLVRQDRFQCCTLYWDELRHFSHLLGSSLTPDFAHLCWARKHLVIMRDLCSTQMYTDPG